MQKIQHVAPGQKPSATTINQLIDAVNANRLNPGVGYTLEPSPFGVSMVILADELLGGQVKLPPLTHPLNPLEVFDDTVGTQDEETFTIDIVAGPGDPPDPNNDPPYDGWKLWKDLRVRYYETGQKAIYTYRYYELIDLWGRTTKIEGVTRQLVVQAEPQ